MKGFWEPMQLPVLAELCIWPTRSLPPGSLSSLGDPPVVTLSFPMEDASLEGTAQVPGTAQCSSAGKGQEITRTCGRELLVSWDQWKLSRKVSS